MTVLLTGLDGANPRDFLAALGVMAAGPSDWRMSWEDDGVWRPRVHGVNSAETLVGVLDEDRGSFASSALLLIKDAQGKRDLKLRPTEVTELMTELMEGDSDRDLRFIASLLSEFVVDGSKGNSKPTALHFTAGKQLFVEMWRQLQGGMTADMLHRGCFVGDAPWSKLPSMSWDSTSSRDWALRVSDPSKEKRLSQPGTEWLGLRGLELLPSAPTQRRLLTALCHGRWKVGHKTWPLWAVPASRLAVRRLLCRGDWKRQHGRAERGVGPVVTSAITRSDQGGYGCFSPSRQG